MTELLANVCMLSLYAAVLLFMFGDRNTWWRGLRWTMFIAGLFLPVALGWSVHTLSALYQVLGGALTLSGVAVVSDWLRNSIHRARERTSGAYEHARQRASRWLGDTRQQARRRWARIWGRPIPPIQLSATLSAHASASASMTLEVHPFRVDRSTISDRDWLVHLDNRVEGLMELLRATEHRHGAAIESLMTEQQKALAAAIRGGWQLVVLGILLSMVGAGLGAWSL